MKTVTLIISSLFLFMALGVSAQQHGPQHRGQRGHMNPEEMVKKQVEQMKTELKLNEQQEKQVKDLFTENIKQRGELMKKRRKEMMDKRGGQRGGHGDPATVNEDHECNGCGGCGKHK